MSRDVFVSIMGDSISTFEFTIPEDYKNFYSKNMEKYTNISTYKDTWWGQVIEHFGWKLLVNNSWSGSFVCETIDSVKGSNGCSDKRTSMLGNNGIVPNHIIVFMGSNDRGRGLSLSEIKDSYSLMLKKIKNNYLNAIIWCCTLPKTACSRMKNFKFPDKQDGVEMICYNKIIIEAAKKENCNVIELFYNDELCDTLDGLHPNYQGMKFIAEKVIFQIEKELNKNK